MKTTEPSIIVEVILRSSIENVWNALTDLEQMKQWYFGNIDAFRPEVGSESKFIVKSEDRTFTHLWKVTEVVLNQKITHTWKFEEYPGDSFVTFELMKEQDRVKLRLSIDVIEDFPDHIPEFSRDSCIGGWNYFLGQNLKEYLKSNSK